MTKVLEQYTSAGGMGGVAMRKIAEARWVGAGGWAGAVVVALCS